MKNIFDVQQLSQFEFGAIIITTLVAGLVFGCLLGYALLKRKSRPEVEAAATIKEEFEEYKDKVDDHFNKTSEMFKDVTTQYKKLYDHMAVGAIELSKTDTITMPRLEMQDADEDVSKDDDPVIDEAQAQTAVKAPDEIAADLTNDKADPENTSGETADQQTEKDNAERNTTKVS